MLHGFEVLDNPRFYLKVKSLTVASNDVQFKIYQFFSSELLRFNLSSFSSLQFSLDSLFWKRLPNRRAAEAVPPRPASFLFPLCLHFDCKTKEYNASFSLDHSKNQRLYMQKHSHT